jgi:predicted metalloendopeptidase
MRLGLLLFTWLLALDASAASGIDTTAIDQKADPCVDFYQYACGNWIAHNPLPADRSQWARFTELSDHTEKVLLDMVQTSAATNAPRGSLDQKIGDYFASCMDTRTIEKKGLAPVEPELQRIRALQTKEQFAAEVGRLHLEGINVLFRFTSEPNPKDSANTIAALVQGGLSLPDRDYYLKTDAKSVETRERFEQHVRQIFQLAGESNETAAGHAKAVLALETLLAMPQLDRVSRRDPIKTYHPTPRAELSSLAAGFAWDQYFQALDAPPFDTVDIE